MLITTPTDVSAIIYDGPLEAADAADRKAGTSAAELQEINVSIGEPVWWGLRDAYRRDGKPIPGTLASLLGDDDAVIVQFAWTFRLPPETTVAFARFSIELSADSSTAPIAFDLFPLRITHEIRRDVRIALAPSLKFSEVVEVSPGEVAVELHYDQLVPTVDALGLQEPSFAWSLREAKGHPITGTKAVHAVVRCGGDTTRINGTCDLQADVLKGRLLLPSAHLSRAAQRSFVLSVGTAGGLE